MSKYSTEIMNEFLKMLNDLCDVGLATTTDIWTSRVQDSYISLTAHFVDRFFRLHR